MGNIHFLTSQPCPFEGSKTNSAYGEADCDGPCEFTVTNHKRIPESPDKAETASLDNKSETYTAKEEPANPGMQVRIHTILVGSDVTPRDERFMRDLANLHRGTFRRVVR